jgi:hypothetical protein
MAGGERRTESGHDRDRFGDATATCPTAASWSRYTPVTKNALSFGLRIQTPDFGDFATDPLVFGARPVDVLNGATPGLVNAKPPLSGNRQTAR